MAMTGNGIRESHGIHTKLSWALRSEPGDRRPINDDFGVAFVPGIPDDSWDRGPFFVVTDATNGATNGAADGHGAGHVASRLAAETALRDWSRRPTTEPAPAIRGAVCAANTAVHDRAEANGGCGMGSTIVAVTLSGHEAIIGNVGDCRAYLVRDDECRELTADSSTSIGSEPSVDIAVSRHPVQQSDVIVLCTDGLANVVADRRDGGRTRKCEGEQAALAGQRLADVLVDLALERAAPDNVTALVVEVTSVLPIPWKRSGPRSGTRVRVR